MVQAVRDAAEAATASLPFRPVPILECRLHAVHTRSGISEFGASAVISVPMNVSQRNVWSSDISPNTNLVITCKCFNQLQHLLNAKHRETNLRQPLARTDQIYAYLVIHSFIYIIKITQFDFLSASRVRSVIHRQRLWIAYFICLIRKKHEITQEHPGTKTAVHLPISADCIECIHSVTIKQYKYRP